MSQNTTFPNQISIDYTLLIPTAVTRMMRLRALLKEITPTPEEMRTITGNFLKMESLVTLYMLLCDIFQEYQLPDSACRANPPQFTANFSLFLFLPFYLSRVYSFFFCKTPQQVFVQITLGLLLNQMIAGIWEIVALMKFFELENCSFNIGYFNLIFYSGYMMHTLLSWLLFPFAVVHLYFKTGKDCQRINQKIQQIANVPSMAFDYVHFKD